MEEVTMEERVDKIPTMLKGMAMGIAEVIPGVSGGTIAFITGIYSRLIASISSFGPNLFTVLKAEGWKAVWKQIDGGFLMFLFFGMLIGATTSVFGVSFLIEHYPEPLWAFFFGLIVASSVFIWRQIDNWNWRHVLLFLIGAVAAYLVISISPAEGSTNPFVIFIAGFIAITAFILPGISGSFILLMMGMYTIIIPTIKSFLESPELSEFKVLAIFGIGCALGLMLFSRVLTWTFKHHENSTYAVLTGFMVASLAKIWPWKNPTQILDKETLTVHSNNVMELLNDATSEYKILSELNVLPHDYLVGEPRTIAVIVSFAAGIALVYLLSRQNRR